MLICKLALLTAMTAITVETDTVVYTTGKDGQGRATVRGSIQEFAAGRLTIRAESGRQQQIDAERIVQIDTAWNDRHRQADAWSKEGKYEQGVNAYIQAWQQESRPWVQRQILASMVRNLLLLRRFDAAADGFLALTRTDPQTHFFDAIPLGWSIQAIDGAFQQKANVWLDNDQDAIASLIGASWLLPITSRQAAATEKLRALSNHTDPRIAFLAAAQLWRLQIATASPQDTQRWQTTIDRMPPSLRSGPYFVLGQAQARQGHSELAAITLMRIPILYSERHDLASQALLVAAAELKKLGQSKEAVRLYQEITRDFPGTQAAAEAQGQLNRVDAGTD